MIVFPAKPIANPSARVVMLSAVCTILLACAGTPDAEQLAANENLVCQKIEVTGTRFAREVCRTPAQWEATSERQRGVAEEFGRQSREGSTLMDPEHDPSGFGTPLEL